MITRASRYIDRARDAISAMPAAAATTRRRQTATTAAAAADPAAADAAAKARRSIKRARALLRLADAAIGRDVRRGIDRSLRDCARGLAGQRDTDALISRLHDIAEALADPAVTSQLPRIVMQLSAGRHAAGAPAFDDQPAAAHELLAQARDALDAAGSITLDPEQVLDAIAAHYRAARRRMRQARSRVEQADLGEADREHATDLDPASEALHEWRKAVQRLLRQLQVLPRDGNEPLKLQIDALRQLARDLGEERDLALLGDRIRQLPNDPPRRARARAAILARCGERAAALRLSVFATGAFAMKARALRDMLVTRQRTRRTAPGATSSGSVS